VLLEEHAVDHFGLAARQPADRLVADRADHVLLEVVVDDRVEVAQVEPARPLGQPGGLPHRRRFDRVEAGERLL
jgi:hypothetical protein